MASVIVVARMTVLALAASAFAVAAPVSAQIRSVDPDQPIDGDLSSPGRSRDDVATVPERPRSVDAAPVAAAPAPAQADPTSAQSRAGEAVEGRGDTYHQDDLIGAATGVFGQGAKGLAGVIEGILKKQGEPNGYIVGREGGGAFIAGVRYGSGTLYHKLEGERPVYWTGPSIGFDAGANVGSAFVLVYNLYDSEDLYKRFVAGEGQAYLVGGFNVSYLRHGDVVLIPVRLGAGLRLGANVGYMKFSHKQDWMPF